VIGVFIKKNMQDNSELLSVFSNFGSSAETRSIELITAGHINETYLVTTDNPGKRYILQRINDRIFRDVPGLMNNILLVTRHIENKLRTDPSYPQHLRPVKVILTKDGKAYHTSEDGSSWRLYDYIGGTRTYDTISNPKVAYEAGKILGLFQSLTRDIPMDSLSETIPFFHHIGKRLDAFRQAVAKDPVNRVGEVTEEIRFVESRAEEMIVMISPGLSGKIPLRVTHNDTKVNNILFTNDDHAVAIVDLDTVMPGYSLFDFGDAIRTGASTAGEDEEDLARVGIDMVLFRQYSKGYLGTARSFLGKEETDHLAFSAKFMTYLIGLRFLTDHIDGDHYYRTRFPGHNLLRAHVQFKLLESMEEHFPQMQKTVSECRFH
jgi:hypothetical protein